jgi:hypothetical protein
MVTLQEANAVGLLDIETATFTAIVPLGTKDFSALLADFSDRDGPGNTTLMNLTTGTLVQGLYMPDAIASFTAGGDVFYVMANEGDDCDDFLNPDDPRRQRRLRPRRRGLPVRGSPQGQRSARPTHRLQRARPARRHRQ